MLKIVYTGCVKVKVKVIVTDLILLAGSVNVQARDRHHASRDVLLKEKSCSRI